MATKAIPVVAAKVTGAPHSAFPVYIQPSVMSGWAAITLAEAQSIRFYSDEAKTTELAREVVSADEIHVKVPSLTTTTTIYADYDGIRADYAVTDTYGRNAVWEDYEMVMHMTDGTTDSTGNNSPTDTGTVAATGKVGGARAFSTDYINVGSLGTFGSTQAKTSTVQKWAKTTQSANAIDGIVQQSTGTAYLPFYTNNSLMSFYRTPGNRSVRHNITTANSNIIRNGNWNSLAVVIDDSTSGNNTAYINANPVLNSLQFDGSFQTNVDWSSNFFIGAFSNLGSPSSYFGGDIDEYRLRGSVLPANWITTEYNNQSDVATFWGTVTDVAAGGNPTGFSVWL